MFIYAIPARSSLKENCGEGKKCFEIFSESNTGIISNNAHKLERAVEGMYHYTACLSEDELTDLVERDDVLGNFSDHIAKGIIGKSRTAVPEIMGIINMTPDSFYEDSRYLGKNLDSLAEVVLNSDIVDIGGESTRPGASPVSPAEELARVIQALTRVREIGDVPVSIDTMHPETLEKTLEFGIQYINDVTGFRDRDMIKIARRENLKCIIMHMRGNPGNMMSRTYYVDLIGEVSFFLVKQARMLLNEGIPPESIILDPGLGFSKDFASNIEILRNMASFNAGFKTLAGHSRKSFIGQMMKNAGEDRLPATLSTSLFLYELGVDIIRVHDPKENRYALKAYDFLRKGFQSP